MLKKNLTLVASAFVAAFLFSVQYAQARSSIGNAVDSYCASRGVTPYGGNCDLCHANDTNYNNARSGNYDSFCPAPSVPTCTDNDGDTYAVEGGTCGPIDCNDNDSAVRPGAAENCTDGFDNNCNGRIDAQDSAAVGCPVLCTDNDGDGYAVDGGTCGQTDCDDSDADVNPGAAEFCGDGIDNNCDDFVDEGCDASCPDADGDGYLDASCGGDDCDDSNPALNPGATEVCGNGVDENCNGASDDTCASGGLFSGHTDRQDGASHQPGKERPYTNGCTDCHGADLRGDIGPSCLSCHGQEWQESATAGGGSDIDNDDDDDERESRRSRDYRNRDRDDDERSSRTSRRSRRSDD